MEISDNSIVVIEDIDCSLDLTAARMKALTEQVSDDEEDENGKGRPITSRSSIRH